MSTIKDALNKIEEFQSTPISHAHVAEPTDSCKSSARATEVPDDLFDIEWSKFTIDGVCVVDLLIRAINTLVTKYNEDVEGRGTDGLTFTFQDIYEVAGIADVDATADAIKPEEEILASLYDKNGFGWRYYCTLKALEKFETDANWDVEIDDKGFDGEFVAGIINRYFNPLSSPFMFGGFGFLDFVPGLRNALTNVDRKELVRLTLEKVLGRYSVLMTCAEAIEIEEEDENPQEPSNDKSELKSPQEPSNDKSELKSPEKKNLPKVESRVVKPQIIQTLPDLLRAIGLPF